MADANANAVQAQAEGAQPAQQRGPLGQIGAIVGGLLRMWLMMTVIKYFIGGSSNSAPASDPATGKPVPPMRPLWGDHQPYNLDVFVSDREDITASELLAQKEALLWHVDGLSFDFAEHNEQAQNISLASHFLYHLQYNGSLYAHAFFTKVGFALTPEEAAEPTTSPSQSQSQSVPTQAKKLRYSRSAIAHGVSMMNVYRPAPKLHARKNLISGEFTDEKLKAATKQVDVIEEQPLDDSSLTTTTTTPDADALAQTLVHQSKHQAWVNYLRPSLTLRLVHDFSTLGPNSLPPEMRPFYQFDEAAGGYYPVIYFDTFWSLSNNLILINETVTNATIEVRHSPISLLKFRFQTTMEQSWKLQQEWGSAESDSEDLKRVFLEANPYFLALTMCVSVLHMVFDFLAFKNDIAFWKNTTNMEGLSVRTLFLNVWSQLVIFLYLLDNETSWMISISSGIGLVIECWKIPKAARVEYGRHLPFPYFKLHDRESYTQSGTAQYDREAMKYLSWALYPLVFGYAVYSLLYNDFKSWYSFVLTTLVGCVYTFGFITMCPQLYVNYKLKSVAHLPWRMLTYKALNTFIDDLFAFMITMPTMHRLSCFRDDIIFFIYLYQRWAYRVDFKRANEFGLVPQTEEEIKAEQEAKAKKEQEQAESKMIENQAGESEKEQEQEGTEKVEEEKKTELNETDPDDSEGLRQRKKATPAQ